MKSWQKKLELAIQTHYNLVINSGKQKSAFYCLPGVPAVLGRSSTQAVAKTAWSCNPLTANQIGRHNAAFGSEITSVSKALCGLTVGFLSYGRRGWVEALTLALETY